MNNKSSMTREKLTEVKNYDQFADLSFELSSEEPDELFDFLFPLAISSRGDSARSVASFLLVELEPKHKISCEEMLYQIAKSSWDVSDKSIPFYLISQFGKWNLIDSYNNYIASAKLTEQQKQRVSTILYWASAPASTLIYPLHAWSFEDLIVEEDEDI